MKCSEMVEFETMGEIEMYIQAESIGAKNNHNGGRNGTALRFLPFPSNMRPQDEPSHQFGEGQIPDPCHSRHPTI